jgi:2-iminoacetate synthase ThiH
MGVAVSALVDRAIEEAGLAPVLASRRRDGRIEETHIDRLKKADLLALGALADRVRAEEVGDEVCIHTADPGDDGDPLLVTVPPEGRDVTGLELLREVAIARVAGPRGARVRVDWARCGLELAQVTLGFGANELVGRIANKRGLPLAEGELLGVGKKSRLVEAQVVKRGELAGFVERAGRTPRFVDGGSPGGPGPGRAVGSEEARDAR